MFVLVFIENEEEFLCMVKCEYREECVVIMIEDVGDGFY